MLRTSKLSNNKVVTQTINIMTITEKHFYGYRFYLNGRLVADSDTFYSSREDVEKAARANVLGICQSIDYEISGERYANMFFWNESFNPADPSSLDDEEDYKQCLANYDRIKHMVETPCQTIYEGVTDSTVPIENGSPYEMTWTIACYTYKEKFEDDNH